MTKLYVPCLCSGWIFVTLKLCIGTDRVGVWTLNDIWIDFCRDRSMCILDRKKLLELFSLKLWKKAIFWFNGKHLLTSGEPFAMDFSVFGSERECYGLVLQEFYMQMAKFSCLNLLNHLVIVFSLHLAKLLLWDLMTLAFVKPVKRCLKVPSLNQWNKQC